jgi:uncharacterized protein YfiM (DUF2279 family)
MKALALLLLCSPALADPWLGQDKALHLVAGAAIASGVTLATKDPFTGARAGCAVGAGKELWDRGRVNHTASAKDFAVTCLGAGLGAYATGWAIQRSGGQTVVSYSFGF